MILSIPFEEIKTFPKEVRLFLNSYFKKKLSESLKVENQVFLNQTSTLHKPADILEAPIFTRHPSRKLVANNKFDWFKFLSKIIEDKNGKHKYDFHFTVTPKKDTEILLNSNGHNIIHDNPKSWGVVLIFCCMFGFGNKFPGLSVAKTTKDISYNIKKIKLSGTKEFSSKIIGPLLKSITSLFQIYAHNYYIKDIHWFTFIKANNEFYFAGETKDLCIKAAAKITQKYFFLSNEDFYELKNKVNTFNELGKEVLENEYLENAGRIFENNQKIEDKL
tara:strand:- start:170 stop:997 length:828 start_codon:yes stop_codon:yes gene_type:complete